MSSRFTVVGCVVTFGLLWFASCGVTGTHESAGWLQLGGMHETIAQGHDEGRVTLAELRGREHLYGVGALEGLAGELTLIDSRCVATGVDAAGAARPAGQDGQATLFVGQSVAAWDALTLAEAVSAARFDATVQARAEAQGRDTSRPFVFQVEGDFDDVRLHVINGACPIRARMHAEELPAEQRPFEWSGARLSGTLIGVYAENAVGQLTHPDTSVHGHLVYSDPLTGERLTAHVERLAVAPGAILRLPAD